MPHSRHVMTSLSAAFFAFFAVVAVPGQAHGQAALDDDELKAPPIPDELEETEKVRYGAGFRGHYLFFPKGGIELFVEEAAGGLSSTGFALDFVRRKGDFELVAGLGYASIRTEEGLFLEKGDEPPAESPDLVEYDGFGWITAEVLFMWNAALHEMFSLRYGAGFGLGIMVGEVLKTDTVCAGASTSTCTPITSGPGEIDNPADVFPVYPVISLRGGAQFRPTKDIAINFDLGLRTAFFAGFGFEYFFR